jgi:hypothetical protein
MSNLLAGLSAAKSFLDRTQHCTEAQPEAAEFAPGASKFESDPRPLSDAAPGAVAAASRDRANRISGGCI